MTQRSAYYEDEYAFDDDGARPGIIGRVLEFALRNPWRTAVAVILFAVAAAIVANAVFLQSGEHPSPLFATRDTDAPAETVAADPAAAPAETAVVPAGDEDEIGRLVAVTTAGTPQVPATPASSTVVEVQQLLLAQGYDPGVVDGLFGANTAAAIEAYQADHGLEVTGTISDELIAALEATMPEQVSEAVVLPTEETQVLAVQTALNLIGYGPIEANGQMNEETATAVRGFQLEYGLDVTGQIDQALIDRMVAIGALETR